VNAAFQQAGQDPEVRSRLAAIGLEVETCTPEQLRSRFQQETEKWLKVAAEAGADPE
jgi:tripartite-type tricarboxylate transporter receptor subunit TctC